MATKAVAILRRQSTDLRGTPGLFTIPSLGFSCACLELPWLQNQSGVSCIPAGSYTVQWTMSAKYKRIIPLVIPTGKRTGIRIHSANWGGSVAAGFKADLLGCIALGTSTVLLNRQWFLQNSRATILKFQQAVGQKEFQLVIQNGREQK